MRPNPPAARLYGLMAREAPLCVLFRRGPTRQFQVISWNTDTDEFTNGQWFKGRIYERRGDLSPDGRYLVYFATKHKYLRDLEKTSWTAVSRPPYLTALGIWFKGDCWSGGGLFESGKKLLLNDGGWSHKAGHIQQGVPFKTGRLNVRAGEDDPIEAMRMARDGWVTLQEMSVTAPKLTMPPGTPKTPWGLFRWLKDPERQMEAVMTPEWFDWLDEQVKSPGYVTHKPRIRQKSLSGLVLRLSDSIVRYKSVFSYTVVGGQELDLKRAKWADWDHRGRLIFARDGCIFAAISGSRGWRVQRLIDLNANRFEELPPPEDALRW